MNEDINIIIDFFSRFYVWELLIIVIAILLTQLIKIPIKLKAEKLEEKYKVDKSMLTQITIILPYTLCAIMVFFLSWYKSGWTLDTLDWRAIILEIAALGSGSIGIYELFKKIIKGASAIKEKKEKEKLPPEKVSYRVKEKK